MPDALGLTLPISALGSRRPASGSKSKPLDAPALPGATSDQDKTHAKHQDSRRYLSNVGGRYGIVVARFNSFVVEALLDGAVDALVRHGVSRDDIEIIRVPGAWEMPVAVKKVIEKRSYDAVIALGAVIRGGTAHFEFVAGEAAKGIASVQNSTGTPVAFGVLTVDTIEQAIERSGTKAGNKGAEAALCALEMVSLFKAL